jgi:hypothetical protein
MDTSYNYDVEEGIFSPRDQAIGWRYWDSYPTKQLAIEAAKKLPIARVLETNVIFQKGIPKE